MHLLSNISRSKDEQMIKFGQLIEYEAKASGLQLSFNKLDRPQLDMQ